MKEFFRNKYVRFGFWSALYILLTVIWTSNPWMLLGEIIVWDLCVSGYLNRYIWQKNKALCARYPLYRSIYSWIDAIVCAVVVATLVHLFIFQLYVVPTSSMEKTILIGDYLYVSKLSYGPQVPNTPVAMPFVYNTMPFSETKKSFSECIRWPYHRLRGLGKVERNDVVVFNFPAGDTVLLENQAVTYYDVLREYQSQWGKQEGRRRLYNDYTVISRPVDKRENYIKRCVAIPGDTIEIRETQLWVNGEPQMAIPTIQKIYFIETDAPISDYAISRLGITEWNGQAPYYYMTLTDEAAQKVKQMKCVKNMVLYDAREQSDEVHPHLAELNWTHDNYGPLWIPQKGATVTLTRENLPLYERIISQYEGHELELTDEGIFIDGVPSESYTFSMDYYWMMGDNRHNSADSRFWGFVPEDHIVGKALFIAFSKGSDGIRWSRIFSPIR